MKKIYVKRGIYLGCWFIGLLLGFLGKDVGGTAETLMALGTGVLFVVAVPLIFEDVENLGDNNKTEMEKHERTIS